MEEGGLRVELKIKLAPARKDAKIKSINGDIPPWA